METERHANKSDYIGVGAICLLLIVRCALFGGGVMWFDEILSFNLIHDPSVAHMVSALGDQADGAPPAYYLIAKVWASVFSDNPVSLRMFSTIAFCLGFTLLWWTMRQVFRFFPTALAFAITIGHNGNILFESLNIRFYGLLFALVSLAVLLGVRLCRSDRPSRYLLAANALTQATLVLCHPLGGFYGAAIMFGVGLSALRSRPARIRVGVFASYGIGWLAILLWWRQFFRQANINQPHSWIAAPAPGDLIGLLYHESSISSLLLLFALLGVISIVDARVCASLPATPTNSRLQLSNLQRVYLVIALCMVGITPLFWVISRVMPSNSIFLSRYMIGTSIGWAILLAYAITHVLGWIPLRSPMFLKGVASLFIAFELKSVWAPLLPELSGKPTPDPQASLTGVSDRAFDHVELPIVCPNAHFFLPRWHYAPDAGRYYYLLNWEAATAPQSPPDATVHYKILAAMKRHYSSCRNIVDASEFLRTNPIFLVYDVPESHWCSLHLRSGYYHITMLEPDPLRPYYHEGKPTMFLVERRS